ncbi:MAG: response regulator [Victivallales bacterium]|nr:response regulator [Victivallales bacterium]
MGLKGRILLAEDENRLRTGMEFVLSGAGYQVIAVADGEQAYQVLKASKRPQQVDILLTDIVMPKIGGVELLQKLRREDLLPPVVLGLSAYADDCTMRQMSDAGCQGMLDKPFHANELLAMIARSNCNGRDA